MDEKTFKERVSRLKKVGKVLETLPAEIRALAFPLISDYVSSEQHMQAQQVMSGNPMPQAKQRRRLSIARDSLRHSITTNPQTTQNFSQRGFTGSMARSLSPAKRLMNLLQKLE